ncbi:AMP-binding protein [Flavobacterium agrisoli]|uniref:AMP-binding protein n=1 Tax=Flavobacterium agrisoli TaxID=2793066 RepID=A0A934UJJ0_9FLAO|nr:AMP-binding protein [Flavobacterium agrisoli]MBK0369947.1 AMP-binding protein [Flavobacterium agrisoli]
MTTTQTITNKNVHNKFKLNGFHLNAADLSRVAYSYIKEGDDFERPIGEFLLDWLDQKSYVNITTSGTTGTPKEIQLPKQAMIASALATGDFFGLQPGDKALHCLSADFIAGKMMIVRSLILGLDLDFVNPSAKPLDKNTTVYDFAAMVPLQVQNSISALKNVKKMIVGGAAMSPELIEKTKNLKTEIYETYGMTETITHVAARRVSEKYFTVLPHIQIHKDDRGCLVIEAPSITDSAVVTNDLVDIANENQFLFLGRIDNVVNSGGVKLIPEVIESKLSGKINGRFFVVGIPDNTLGEKLILVIEGVQQEIDPTIFDILDKYEKPKEIRFVTKFKETENGKIKRKETVLN